MKWTDLLIEAVLFFHRGVGINRGSVAVLLHRFVDWLDASKPGILSRDVRFNRSRGRAGRRDNDVGRSRRSGRDRNSGGRRAEQGVHRAREFLESLEHVVDRVDRVAFRQLQIPRRSRQINTQTLLVQKTKDDISLKKMNSFSRLRHSLSSTT
jgi:hypothetical protein